MDAVPITLGAVFGGFAAQVSAALEHLEQAKAGLLELALGGTAVGTGLNAPDGFAALVATRIAARTGIAVAEARNHVAANAARDALVHLSAALRGVAITLHKVANDIRLMGSGPHAGLAELRLPELAAGSSIMPGKVNPIIPEVVVQVAAQVVGNDAAVAFAGAGGAFEITATIPVIGRNVLQSTHLLASAASVLADKCVTGLAADVERMRAYAEASPSVVTGLNASLGYAEAADIAKEALRTGTAIREIVLARGHVREGRITEAELDAALDVDALARGKGSE
jgi:fumarate hydratase class II